MGQGGTRVRDSGAETVTGAESAMCQQRKDDGTLRRTRVGLGSICHGAEQCS